PVRRSCPTTSSPRRMSQRHRGLSAIEAVEVVVTLVGRMNQGAGPQRPGRGGMMRPTGHTSSRIWGAFVPLILVAGSVVGASCSRGGHGTAPLPSLSELESYKQAINRQKAPPARSRRQSPGTLPLGKSFKDHLPK